MNVIGFKEMLKHNWKKSFLVTKRTAKKEVNKKILSTFFFLLTIGIKKLMPSSHVCKQFGTAFDYSRVPQQTLFASSKVPLTL